MKAIVVTCQRRDLDGNLFQTIHRIEHTPVNVNPDECDWFKNSCGLSDQDITAIARVLTDTACNIVNFQVTLGEEM